MATRLPLCPGGGSLESSVVFVIQWAVASRGPGEVARPQGVQGVEEVGGGRQGVPQSPGVS